MADADISYNAVYVYMTLEVTVERETLFQAIDGVCADEARSIVQSTCFEWKDSRRESQEKQERESFRSGSAALRSPILLPDQKPRL